MKILDSSPPFRPRKQIIEGRVIFNLPFQIRVKQNVNPEMISDDMEITKVI